MSAPIASGFAHQLTTTAGTFNTISLSATGVAVGLRLYERFRRRVADGASVYVVRSQDIDATHELVWEAYYGTLHYGSTDTITPVTGVESSSSSLGSGFVPINWGSNTSDVWSVPPAYSMVTAETLVSMLTSQAAAVRAALALGTAALLDTGTAPSKIPLLAAVGAGGLADLTQLSPYFSGERIAYYTGGSNNTICRPTAYSGGVLTVVVANGINGSLSADSRDQLSHLWCRGSDANLYWPKSIVPMAGMGSFGTVYFLGSAGALHAPPTPSPQAVPNAAFEVFVRMGVSLGSGWFLFDPWQMPIGARSSGTALYLEGNQFSA